jgi:hypothetical protein
LDIRFDPVIVPRAPDDPVYEQAAAARREYWQRYGDLAPDPAAERGTPNTYGQTKWFGPHRRVLRVNRPGSILLATDGLSTPWAGVADRVNGVECELVLEWPERMNAEQLQAWADLMISLGDRVADRYRVARDVQTHRALLFSGLSAEFKPMSFVIFSSLGAEITGLSFGPVPLIRVTPVREDEMPPASDETPWESATARDLLKRCGIIP